MPYTPPAQQSPGVSTTSSPSLSRRHSYNSSNVQSPQCRPASSPLQLLPRSASSSSYLTMHRRSPSASKLSPNPPSSEQSPCTNEGGSVDSLSGSSRLHPQGSNYQLVPANTSSLFTEAITSAPESLQNSSDEEDASRGRGRRLENLAELQAAIRIIEQRKESSPDGTNTDSKGRLALDLAIRDFDPCLQLDSTSSNCQRPPLSKEARKISHSRSSTDSNIVLDGEHHALSPAMMRCNRPGSDEDEADSDESSPRCKPPMVRKKSGELVRPALRPTSFKRRPSSMPGTPTYSKAVHFDSHLEHVRHFLQVDKPLAVSAGSSPVDTYDSEIDFPFGHEESERQRGPSYEWELRLSNFPAETEGRTNWPVRVERVFLSSDNKNLIGVVAVQNLAFYKQVAARFTFDYWKTTSEVAADFNNDVRRKEASDGCDRFNFTIKLTDQADLEHKTMFFCIRYDVNGQQYWDNNRSMNYQVEFAKKAKRNRQDGMSGLGSQPLNGLPRSRPSPPISATGGQSRPMLQPPDDFASGFDSYAASGQFPTAIIGDSSLSLKVPRSRAEFFPDAPTRRPKANGQLFGNRYDFGASLSAAIQNASTILGEQSGLMKTAEKKQVSRQTPTPQAKPTNTAQHKSSGTVGEQTRGGAAINTSVDRPAPAKPAMLVSEKPSLQSQSYQELVDKYCFFGSAKTSPHQTQSTLGRAADTRDNSDASVCDMFGSGGSTTAAASVHPFSLAQELPLRSISPQFSRSSSPNPKTGSALSDHIPSPVSFGYPYHQCMGKGLFDTHTATAIQG